VGDFFDLENPHTKGISHPRHGYVIFLSRKAIELERSDYFTVVG